ncbi:ElyC/SanA/YdcF family protein [Spirulina sp. CS-785/01]|uniref:YdcF family protein n=1 Tax=Spirulina sp. CS-785/01 TaxID=3021716 RepID=UPI002330123A|nr:ElyC/SanA/YdcF family protein [Spirulina sp. CS-785/01]MDB9314218.1 ElyC/SanA/YdcF family protein [Spirulina sp. CS-785/01]
MFAVLASALLILLIGVILYYLLVQVIPRATLTLIGVLFILGVVLLSFFNPTYPPIDFLWRILSFPFRPLGLSLIFLLAGISRIQKNEIKPPAPVFLWAAMIILVIFSNPWVAHSLARVMEWEGIRIEQERQSALGILPDPAAVEAIVLLAEGTTEPNIPYRTQIQLTKTGDRLLYTARLVRQQQQNFGKTPRIIVCANPRQEFIGTEEQLNEAEDVSQVLRNLGVINNQIIPAVESKNLRQTALEVRETLTNLQLQNAPFYLITSGIQNRRAIQTFRQVDLNPIARPTDFYTFQTNATPRKRLQVRDILPSTTALEISTEVIEEFFLLIYYFIRGWLSPIVF